MKGRGWEGGRNKGEWEVWNGEIEELRGEGMNDCKWMWR